MVLATADEQGTPSARTVLATVIDDAGVVFNSSHPSRKTLDLAANPKASAVFGWYGIGRQVVLSGAVDPLPDAEVDAAFSARDPGCGYSPGPTTEQCAPRTSPMRSPRSNCAGRAVRRSGHRAGWVTGCARTCRLL